MGHPACLAWKANGLARPAMHQGGRAWAERSACQAARPGTTIRLGLGRPGLYMPGQSRPGPGQVVPPIWPSIFRIHGTFASPFLCFLL
jgi:hypothetical protein